MADPEENVSLNEDDKMEDSSDKNTKCTLNVGQDDDSPSTFKDLVGLSEAEKRHLGIAK